MPVIDSYRDSYSIYMTPIDRSEVNVNGLQVLLDKVTQETATAGTTDYYGDIPNSRLFLERENLLTSIQNYKSDITVIYNRQQMINYTSQTIKNLAAELRSKIQDQLSSSPIQDVGFQTVVGQMRQQLTSLLNTQYNDEYIFSGQATQTASVVDIESLPAVAAGSSPDYSYYQGSSQTVVETLDDTRYIAYNPTAASQGFEELIRSLNLCLNASPSTAAGKARLEEAFTLSYQAIDDIGGINQQVGANIQYIDQIKDQLSIDEKITADDIKSLGFRSQIEAWMDYYTKKGQMDLIRNHWIESVRATTQLIDSIRY